jgi:hypothetical protein
MLPSPQDRFNTFLEDCGIDTASLSKSDQQLIHELTSTCANPDTPESVKSTCRTTPAQASEDFRNKVLAHRAAMKLIEEFTASVMRNTFEVATRLTQDQINELKCRLEDTALADSLKEKYSAELVQENNRLSIINKAIEAYTSTDSQS